MTLVQVLAAYIAELRQERENLAERILEAHGEERCLLVGERQGLQIALDMLQRKLGL